ncbi:MAG: DUF935 family protein [Cyanobacteria bacterium J06638_20]
MEAEIRQPLLDLEVAGVDKDPALAWVGALIPFLDPLLRERGGLEAAEKVADDEQVKSCWQQRVEAQKSFEWMVEPGADRRDAKRAAEWVEGLLNDLGFDDLTEKLSWTFFYGFSVAELMLTADEGKVTLDFDRKGIRVRRRDRFRFTAYGEPRLIWRNSIRGEELDPSRIWSLSYGGDHDDDPNGRGLWRWLFFPVLFKRGGMRAWLRYLEDFAAPTVGVETPANASLEEKQKALQLAQAIRSGTSFRKTQGTVVELVEASRSGTADYSALHAACEAAISKIILSQTMTTDNGSSLSQAEVHEGVALRVIKSDADWLCAAFNREVLARRLCHWNFPGVAPPRVWRKVEPPEDAFKRAETDEKIFGWGYRPTPDYVAAAYGDNYLDLQAPPEGEEEQEPPLYQGLQVGGTQSLLEFLTNNQLPRVNALAILQRVFGLALQDAEAMLPSEEPPTQPPEVTDSGPAEEEAETGEEEAEFAERLETPEIFAEQLRRLAQPEMAALVQRIRDELNGATSLVEFQAALDRLYPQLGGDDLARVMAEAMTAARFAGIYEAQEEGSGA